MFHLFGKDRLLGILSVPLYSLLIACVIELFKSCRRVTCIYYMNMHKGTILKNMLISYNLKKVLVTWAVDQYQ